MVGCKEESKWPNISLLFLLQTQEEICFPCRMKALLKKTDFSQSASEWEQQFSSFLPQILSFTNLFGSASPGKVLKKGWKDICDWLLASHFSIVQCFVTNRDKEENHIGSSWFFFLLRFYLLFIIPNRRVYTVPMLTHQIKPWFAQPQFFLTNNWLSSHNIWTNFVYNVFCAIMKIRPNKLLFCVAFWFVPQLLGVQLHSFFSLCVL